MKHTCNQYRHRIGCSHKKQIIKVFHNGKYVRKVNLDASPHRHVMMFRLAPLVTLGVIAGIITINGLVQKASAYIHPPARYERYETTKEKIILLTDETRPNILAKIAKCESGDTAHPKHVNPRDVGRYGINQDAWGEKAIQLGYDISSDEGNYQMAKWIYQNRGTEDWKYSKHCWLK